MIFQKVLITRLVVLSICTLLFSTATSAQSNDVPSRRPMTVATGNNLYCAGYIQTSGMPTGDSIIGGQNEADKYNYSQNDHVYINLGHDRGVKVGDMFAVVRPRGQVNSKWSRKDDLGFWVQELGALEVVRVKQNVAVAVVKVSCDSMLLGDLIQPIPQRVSPVFGQWRDMDKFGDASGKATGRVLMSRTGAESVTRDFIVYVDLGADDNVQVGDRLTIFRPLKMGNLTRNPDKESITSRDYGFESSIYRGGKFSNQAARKSGERARGKEVTTNKAKEGRPEWLRKVVGEAVVLNVKEKTATVVITRTAQEIHTGDWVEIQ